MFFIDSARFLSLKFQIPKSVLPAFRPLQSMSEINTFKACNQKLREIVMKRTLFVIDSARALSFVESKFVSPHRKRFVMLLADYSKIRTFDTYIKTHFRVGFNSCLNVL